MDSQPGFVALHVLPKAAAVVLYFVLSRLVSDLLAFVLVLFTCAVDFWVVKNITGRKLLALRWWTDLDENGDEAWIFESQERENHPADSNAFWASQAIAFLFWAVLAFLNLLTLSLFWLMLDLIAATLAGANLIGYYKCKGEHQTRLGTIAADARAGVMNRYMQ
jgi:hypothetical protein